VKHCWVSQLPEVEGVVELVLGKTLGCGGPQCHPRHWHWGAVTAGAVALAPVPGASPPSRVQVLGARELPYAPLLCNTRGRRDLSLKKFYQASKLGRIDHRCKNVQM
jgi:hypothetical protein